MSTETEVLFFDLYNKLSRRLRKVVANGTEVPFSQEDIEIVLRHQGVRNTDLPAAIEQCLSRGILKKEEDSFFVTESGLAAYHADLRRI